MLGIGPAIKTPYCFDLLCYREYIEFYMEECRNVRFHEYELENIKHRLKMCLGLLHSFKIIHKDIKPANVLFSPIFNNYVLCDFGLSTALAEDVGFKTHTYREGTLGYMCEELRSLKTNTRGWVDLYFNDIYGLEVTL
jgi:serine/threonine protein kinase